MIEYDTYGGVPLYAYQIIPPRTTAQIDPYNQFAGFVQDSWKINKYLVANVGLRYDYVDVYHPPQREQTTRLPLLNWKTLEPRIALGIDPFGDGKTGIKIGYSRFAQMMWTWFYSLNPNGQKMIMYYVVAPGVFFPIYESEAYNFEMDPDIKRPYVDEFLISVDRAISKDLALKISFVDRQFRKTVTANDLHITADWFEPIQVINPLTNQPMTVYDLKSGAPTSTLDYYSNDPHAKKHYQGIVAELDKKLSNNYMFRISYNFSRIRSTSVGDNMGSSMYATGYWNWPNNSLYDYGLTDSTMHVFKFQGIWYAPFGIILSAGYLGQSGYQYAATFREALNIGFTTFYAEAPSSRRMPFVHYLDFKVGKDFKLGNSNLSVFADIYNALNLNAATDVYSILGSPLFGKTIGIQSGRLVQFGARIQF
jgi:outer membrane receptor protein involved in Fe transport